MANLEAEMMMRQMSQLHDYVRITGQLSLHWFLYVSTINAAVVGWLIQTKRVELARVIPLVSIVCDVLLGVGYAIWLPLYYLTTNAEINKLLEQLRSTGASSVALASPMPAKMWTVLAVLVAFTYLGIACLWYYFFYTTKGQKRLRTLVAGMELPQ
ncbi:MAG: hypothetical protein ACYSWU_09015 [Planctomycetota bacterium]|jgi:hypothetical protein